MEQKTSASFSRSLYAFSNALARAFPTPKLLTPPGAGIDISDASIKWLVLEQGHTGFRVATYGEEPLAGGIVVNGIVKDVAALGAALHEVKKHLGGIRFAHAALPEEAAYVFEMHVPEGTNREQTLRLIEFEFEARVPITPEMAVFDFDIIQRHDDGGGEEIAVAVFPRELAESYVSAFNAGGITLLSLELEACSIARAISSREGGDPITLLVDFGRARTGFAVLKHGIPIFTSTVEVGGDAITRALKEKLSFSPEEAVVFRNEQGLVPEKSTNSGGLDAVAGVASALSDEVTRHYHYWDTRRNERGERMTPVGRVTLVGGSANLRGLTDYIAGRVQAPCLLGDVWSRVCDFDTYIPPIDRRTSLQYATAVGLALRPHMYE
jgi:type IV pilus assembly protein PilM